MADWVEARKMNGLFAASIQPPPPPRPPQTTKASTTPARPTSSPVAELGTIVIQRRPKLTGFFYKIKVSADLQAMGEIPGGVLDLLSGKVRHLEFHVPVGAHRIDVVGGGLKGFVMFGYRLTRPSPSSHTSVTSARWAAA